MAPPPPQEDAIDGVAEAGVEDPEVVEPWVPSSDSEPDSDHPASALEPPTPSAAAAEPELQPVRTAVEEEEREGEEARPRWPGWPGASVFRLVVTADKVGGVIGRRGETIRRLCDETRARVRVLDAAHGAANRIVLVSATEEVEAELSPAMSATIKIFRHINEIEEINGTLSASAPEICFVRLLVPAAQAAHLIGTQGVTVKSIQESTGATIRIIDEDELLNCETLDERIVEIQGASLKVHSALKSVLGLLRKFLVDHGVLHLFERKNQEVAQPQDSSKENQVINDYPLEVNQDFWLSDQRSHGNPIGSRMLYEHHPSSYDPYPSDICHTTDSLMTQLGHANPEGSRFLYGRNPSFCDPCSPDLREPSDPLITQITQTMQIPLPYAEQIIGTRGENIEFIRSVSGAVVVLEEIRDYPGEVLVMITGSSSQVQTTHQLLQEVLSGNRGLPPPPPSRIFYCGAGAGARLTSPPHAGPRLPTSPPHAGPRLLSSPHTCPRCLHSPHAIATSPDLPWRYEDRPPRHP